MSVPVRDTDRARQLDALVEKERLIRATIDEFHRMYYAPAHESQYMGLPLWKSPPDMFVYQDVIWGIRPQLIIECGTAFGASALFMVHYMEKAGIDGRVLTIDIAEGDSFDIPMIGGPDIPSPLPRHERITYLRGCSSTSAEVAAYLSDHVELHTPTIEPVMVILDSDHRQAHVAAELENYAGWVTPGSVLVVEDTNVNGHPVYPDHGPGPYEAVDEWLPKHPEFEIVQPWAKYLFTMHTWLRRK